MLKIEHMIEARMDGGGRLGAAFQGLGTFEDGWWKRLIS
jgi:hypothetical protein